jgi:hypothetical protein
MKSLAKLLSLAMLASMLYVLCAILGASWHPFNWHWGWRVVFVLWVLASGNSMVKSWKREDKKSSENENSEIF